MKKEKTKLLKKLLYVLIAIIIIAGIAVGCALKFNFSLAYDDSNRIEVYLGKDYSKSDIESIAKEAFGTNNVLVQKIEFFNDSVAVTVREQNDEQLENFVNKLNEKYETELEKDDLTIVKIPHYRGRDIMANYLLPIGISAIIIIAYEAIRFRKIGVIKTILKLIIWPVIIEALYVSILAITRIPIGIVTIPLVITVYLLTLVGLTTYFEKQLTNKINKETSK